MVVAVVMLFEDTCVVVVVDVVDVFDVVDVGVVGYVVDVVITCVGGCICVVGSGVDVRCIGSIGGVDGGGDVGVCDCVVCGLRGVDVDVGGMIVDVGDGIAVDVDSSGVGLGSVGVGVGVADVVADGWFGVIVVV